MHLTWQPPQNYRSRPVAVLGAGVLGRRIACIWASAGYDVRIRDPSPEQRADCTAYIQANVHSYGQKTSQSPGTFEAFEDIEATVSHAWLVIEAVPEKLELKIATFAQLEAVAPQDCILASNSSSYKTSEMIEKVSDATKARILNMHYYMPPECMIVELMTDGYTDEGIFPFMVDRSKEAATLPYVARKQSTGFIFNRLWAAIKREVLTMLAEGVSVPEEIDSMWTEMFIKSQNLPCALMDKIGLDTVAFIESHYVHERGLSPEKTVNFLKQNYLDHGKLGTKSEHGGLYPSAAKQKPPSNSATKPRILALDVGLCAATWTTTSGEVLELSSKGKIQRVLVPSQPLPDGIVVDTSNDRMFWTCMGVPGKDDGAVYSANLDGSDIRTVVPQGGVNTPKQITLDDEAKKLYFCDREGCRVFRCNTDGSDLEVLIDRRDVKDVQGNSAIFNWCVGITVAPKFGKFYWTQKGPSKGGNGRIFSASITTPQGQTARSREDVQLVFGGLPEPIDLELDEESNILYWTDRGEYPYGNSLNKAQLDQSGLPASASEKKYDVITRNLKEAIGLKLDLQNGHIYLTDLGGSIYRCDLDGGDKEKIHSDDYRAFTGIALF
ncbi:NAD(P)-binding protein [Aspergillus avenaceus]|uniref:NAD(P)-binding protein n=1 Tax=Aspergillus avenaceus TaxID=36643 RepID=A0A5N6TLD2_ASPAV|nr:NAD(P)-binding protein [Aspergillus avenaceus]